MENYEKFYKGYTPDQTSLKNYEEVNQKLIEKAKELEIINNNRKKIDIKY